MKIDLAPDVEAWIEAELARGRFTTAEAAIQHAVNVAKIDRLRGELAAAEAEGGAHSVDEVRHLAMTRFDDHSVGPGDAES